MLDGSAVGVHCTKSPQLATVAVHERIHEAVAARNGSAAKQRYQCWRVHRLAPLSAPGYLAFAYGA